MPLRYSRSIAAVSALLLSLASVASADVLWDQSNWDTVTPDGSVNLSSNACNQISGNTKVHTTNDVHFDYPVHITTVRIYEKQGNVETATLAYLWIAPKTGPVPTTRSDSLELPALQVPITISYTGVLPNQAVVVSAAGLDIELPAGDYWVSLTPRHNLGIFPYSIHYQTSGPVVGVPTVAVEACTVNTNWYNPLAPIRYPDYAMKIEGDLRGPPASMPTGVRGEAPAP